MYCRLCCCDSGKKPSLKNFRYDGYFSWLQLIQKYLPLQLKPNELEATTICKICARNLKDFHVFNLHVERCQLTFESYKNEFLDHVIHNEVAENLTGTGNATSTIHVVEEESNCERNDATIETTNVTDAEALRNKAAVVESLNDAVAPEILCKAKEEETDNDVLTETWNGVKEEEFLNENETTEAHATEGDLAISAVEDEDVEGILEHDEDSETLSNALNETTEVHAAEEDLAFNQNEVDITTIEEHVEKETENSENLIQVVNETPEVQAIVEESVCNQNDSIVETVPDQSAVAVVENETEIVEILDDEGESYAILNEAESETSDVEIIEEVIEMEENDVKTETYEEEVVTETFPTVSNVTETTRNNENNEDDYSTDDSIEVRAFASSDDPKHKCNVCGKIFTGLKNHMPKFHRNTKPFTCKLCDLSMHFKYELRRHMFLVHKKKKLTDPKAAEDEANRTCVVCYKTFNSKRILSKHMQTQHKSATPYNCSRCGLKFTSKSKYDHHIRRPHECTNPKTKDFNGIEYRTCGVCGKIFNNVRSLKGHVNSKHNGVKPFKCVKCKAKFDLKQSLECHKLECSIGKSSMTVSNTGLERNTCNICFQKFDQFSSFYQHMAHSHESPTPFQCQICRQTFMASLFLRVHLRTTHFKPT